MTPRRRPPETDPTRAVAYLRLSADEPQGGTRGQEAAIRRWSDAEGVNVVTWHKERVSDGVPLDQRPALLGAIEALAKESAGLLVVAQRDRIARDVVVAAMIERLAQKSGSRVVSADGASDHSSELRRRIVDAMAQYDRALGQHRTKAALAAKRRRGEKTGGDVPYGFRVAKDGRTLERDDEEQEVIEQARMLRTEGKSYRAICEALADRGFSPRSGGRWWPMTVRRMLNYKRGPSVRVGPRS